MSTALVARVETIEEQLQSGDARFSKIEGQITNLTHSIDGMSDKLTVIEESVGSLKAIEQTVKAIQVLGKVIVWIGGVSTSVIAVIKVLEFAHKYMGWH